MTLTPALTRAEVYTILDTERAYQDRIAWPENAPSEPVTLTIGEELLTILGYLRKRDLLLRLAQPQEALLELIRKITAMGVRAFENQGLTREQAYQRIDAAYATLEPAPTLPSVDEALDQLVRLAEQAHEQWLVESRPELKTLDLLGAMSAQGVRAMESHGCLARKLP